MLPPDTPESLALVGSEIARAREGRASLRTLRRGVEHMGSRRPVVRSLRGAPTYELAGRRGLKVRATLYGPGQEVVAFTRETHTGETEVVALIQGKAARQVFRDMRGMHRQSTSKTKRSHRVQSPLPAGIALAYAQPGAGRREAAVARDFAG
jgi:hypothetical protein